MNQIQPLLNVKLNLFLDVFYVLSKVIDPYKNHIHNTLNHIRFTASLCRGAHGGRLDLLKFLLDELAYLHVPYSSVHNQVHKEIGSMCALMLQDAYLLDNLDTAVSDYLTKTKGLNPAYEPSTYRILFTLQPYSHVECYKYPFSPLHNAVLCGNVSTVRALMAPTGDLFHARYHLVTKYYDTLLHSACVSGNREMVEMMIQELAFNQHINAQNALRPYQLPQVVGLN